VEASILENDLFFNESHAWFKSKDWQAFPFQEETWEAYAAGCHGLLNAPTGSGKTYALVIPILREIAPSAGIGLQAIWISPIRALTKEINLATQRAIDALGLDVRVEVRTGDTTITQRKRQKESPPDILITTPESLHIMLATKGNDVRLKNLVALVADEWHELMGSKRGVQVELALSRLKGIAPRMRIWGISATIGNMGEAIDVLLGPFGKNQRIIKADIDKAYDVVTILPDHITDLPWAGHIGMRLLDKVLPIIYKSQSTLIFTNTRSQCELWYQRLLEFDSNLAGIMAMHHSSISDELRHWVEDGLHAGSLKVVVCTSSLDLGVDFSPVETIIQIGGPKGVARFMQRAGRSGHSPGAVSRIYFVPTHALELIEGTALRHALDEKIVESRIPYIRCFDVLVQYLLTLAAAEGFNPDEIKKEVLSTHCYNSLTDDEWQWTLNFIVYGSQSLSAYDEYQKAGYDKNGIVRIKNKTAAHIHRLSIGTIVGSNSLRIKFANGKTIGTVEEYFISHLLPNDTFWFAGRSLELIRIKGDDVIVQISHKKKGKVPSWQGGRMPLSTEMADILRRVIAGTSGRYASDPEIECLAPLLELQEELSIIPQVNEFLIEYIESEEGFHLLVFPFEGRIVHEGLGGLLAYRIGRLSPLSFSIGMNDYGLELLSDQPIPLTKAIKNGLFSTVNLREDLDASINKVEMARRRFRDISSISGLIFKGYPGRMKRGKHLQSSASMLFEIFHEYEPDNLLYLQAYEEAALIQYEEQRMRAVLDGIKKRKVVIKKPKKITPFAFPIMVDRLREKLTTESLQDRVKRMSTSSN
jgi:ATP-dependent Lhr-like helicase